MQLANLVIRDVVLIFRGYVAYMQLNVNIAHAAVPTHMIVLPIKELSNIDIPSNEERRKGQV